MLNTDIGRVWRPKIFIGCYLAAALLVGSFVWGPLVEAWQWLDLKVYYALNGSLTWGGAWTFVWGHLNTRPLDVTWAIVMGLPCLWMLFIDRRHAVEVRFSTVFVIAFAVLIGVLTAKTSFGWVERISPSYHPSTNVFHDVNSMLEGINAKVGSNDSFPGDHGVAALIYAVGFIALFRSPGITAIALFIAAMNTLPRLIGGGHWLTDVVVGGGSAALIMTPWLIAAPTRVWMEKAVTPLLDHVIRPVFSRIGLGSLLR